MGVRFECPQGHKLHVKAHLAGQRGICPECGARFIVPSFSGGRVSEAPSSASNGYVTVDMESTATFNAGLDASAVEAALPGDSFSWYVRPATGGQYGPVDTAEFRHWIDEGRVAADSWVWRTGWSDWRPGAEAVRSLAGEQSRRTPPAPPKSAPPKTAPAASSNPFPSRAPVNGSRVSGAINNATRPAARSREPARMAATAASAASGPATSPVLGFEMDEDFDGLYTPKLNGRADAEFVKPAIKTAAYDRRMRRRKVNQVLTLVLAVVALVLMVVAIVVLNRPSETAPDEIAAPVSSIAS